MDRVVAKHLLHVELGQEWPVGTLPDEYLTSLEHTIRNQQGGISLERDEAGDWRLVFVGRSGRWRGPDGGNYILVGFLAEDGCWMTGFQPEQGLAYVTGRQRRADGRWLRRPS